LTAVQLKKTDATLDRGLGELEQLLLFALVALSDDAYGVSVRELIEAETGRTLSPGAVYTGYERLERRGMVTSELGEPTPIRGGRPKRFYAITKKGARALADSYGRLTSLANRSRLRRLEELARG
jgi:DNA-binding PadR family transcriptional regulator